MLPKIGNSAAACRALLLVSRPRQVAMTLNGGFRVSRHGISQHDVAPASVNFATPNNPSPLSISSAVHSNMRLPYAPNPPVFDDAADAAVVERIAARRAPRPLQPLDLALLHAPPVADGWNAFLGAVRTRTPTLGADLREIAVCRVAVVNRAWYEWGHHAPLAAAAGVSPAGMAAVAEDVPLAVGDKTASLTAQQWAVLVYADEMTRRVAVADATFAHVRTLFDERQIVELTAVVGVARGDGSSSRCCRRCEKHVLT